MELKKNLLFASILFFTITSCNKSNNPKPQTDVDVYIAGTVQKNVTNGFIDVAAYWKNGALTTLSDTNPGIANAIAVKGTDIYVAGYTLNSYNNNYQIGGTNSNPTIGTYWKNGISTKLLPNTMCTAIAVNGTDIYVAGYSVTPNANADFSTPTTDNRVGFYLKNGIATTLGPNTTCSSIAVIGTDVYITGAMNNTAVYWKNGIMTSLEGGLPGSWTNAIAVNGNDIYIVGTINSSSNSSMVAYWKNGIITELTTDASTSLAQSIAVNGNDVYIAGNVNGRASYWKNGTLTVLADLSIPTVSTINAIAVNNNNVYAAGYVGLGAAYWKNGTALLFGPIETFGSINAVTIAPH